MELAIAADGFRTLPDGKPLVITVSTSTDTFYRDLDTLWQKSLQRIGLRTRFELVCWELNVDQRLAWPAWELALKHGLLETAGVDAVTGKTMFTLSERGRLALRNVRGRSSSTR